MSVFTSNPNELVVSMIDKRIKEGVTKEIASVVQKNEIEVKQTEALTTLAEGVKALATFVSGGGLQALLNGYAKSQAVKDILGGLAAHDGRNALDARVLGQNAIDIVHQIEAVFDKYAESLASKAERDPEVKDGENEFKKWAEKQCQKQES